MCVAKHRVVLSLVTVECPRIGPQEEFSEAIRDIKGLLDSMAEGRPLSRSENLSVLARKIAVELRNDTDADVETWASHLARDLSKGVD